MELLYIKTDNCGKCQYMEEILNKILPDYPQIELRRMNINDNLEEVLEINPTRRFPFFMINGEIKTGACVEEEFRNFINYSLFT